LFFHYYKSYNTDWVGGIFFNIEFTFLNLLLAYPILNPTQCQLYFLYRQYIYSHILQSALYIWYNNKTVNIRRKYDNCKIIDKSNIFYRSKIIIIKNKLKNVNNFRFADNIYVIYVQNNFYSEVQKEESKSNQTRQEQRFPLNRVVYV